MKLSNILKKKNRVLLFELVATDFKLRYQGSVLGYLWSLLKPLMLFAVMYVVFVNFLKFGEGINHFAVMLLLGTVMWSFFTEATSQGMQSIVLRGDLIRKINFPKYVIVISATVSALINFLLNLVVVFIFMAFDGVQFGWSVLLFPITILVLYGFALALAFWLSALYVKFRDIAHLWEVFLQAMFYATPIIYPLQMVIEKVDVTVAQALMLNPVAVIIQNGRAELVGKENVVTADQLFSNPLWIALPYIVIIVIAVVASLYFKKSQGKFAENM